MLISHLAEEGEVRKTADRWLMAEVFRKARRAPSSLDSQET